jgi:hypothetical protein
MSCNFSKIQATKPKSALHNLKMTTTLKSFINFSHQLKSFFVLIAALHDSILCWFPASSFHPLTSKSLASCVFLLISSRNWINYSSDSDIKWLLKYARNSVHFYFLCSFKNIFWQAEELIHSPDVSGSHQIWKFRTDFQHTFRYFERVFHFYLKTVKNISCMQEAYGHVIWKWGASR